MGWCLVLLSEVLLLSLALGGLGSDLLVILLKVRMAAGAGVRTHPRPPKAGGNLVLLALLLALALGRLGADLLVVLLEGGEVLAGLWVWRRRGKRVSVGCRDGVLGC